MLLEKLTEAELELCETLYNPIALAECLFSDFDNLGEFREDKFGDIRPYQYSMMSYEYMIDGKPNPHNDKTIAKENFKLREGAGKIYAIGGRKYGKTKIVEEIDMMVSMVLLDGALVGFSSYDALHIRGILEKVIQGLEMHPFFDKILDPKINRSPNYHFYLRNGYTLDSINMNLSSKSPGSQFFQKHFNRLYIEECSFETEEVNKSRIDAISELGCVERLAGMTNFTRYSPIGKIFTTEAHKPWISNYPQFVNPLWDEKTKQQAARDHGGENSVSYRVFVRGEVVEEGIAVFDRERVKKCFDESRTVKHFEVKKDNFPFFQNLIIVDRPEQTEQCFICADIGESAPTEIIIVFLYGGIYHYVYNITLYNLTDKEQLKIFTWLYEKLGGGFIGLDTTEGTGRAIYRSLNEIYPQQQLVWCSFNEKTTVGFEKDANNNVIFEDGKPKYKEEFVADWTVKRLRDLFYDEKMHILYDHKLDIQLNSVIASINATRTVYECVSEEDHLFAAFRVFGLAQWLLEFSTLRPLAYKKFGKCGA